MITLSNTQHWLNEQAIKQPNNRAVLTPKKELTYKELFNECLTTANYLFSLGIKKGDRVGILFEHSYEFFVTINALWFIGSVPVPLNTRNTIEEIQNQLNQADIKFLILHEILNLAWRLPTGQAGQTGSQFANCELRIANCKLQIANCKLTIL